MGKKQYLVEKIKLSKYGIIKRPAKIVKEMYTCCYDAAKSRGYAYYDMILLLQTHVIV